MQQAVLSAPRTGCFVDKFGNTFVGKWSDDQLLSGKVNYVYRFDSPTPAPPRPAPPRPAPPRPNGSRTATAQPYWPAAPSSDRAYCGNHR